MEKIAQYIKWANDLVWGPWMLVLLVGTGCWLMMQLRFLPLRSLGSALRWAVGRTPRQANESGVSSFAALSTELAATIGTGNIVGVSTAMVLGGPGALVWMVLSGVVGMATKLTESTLAVKYRSSNERGEPVGGPMYYLQRAFPQGGLGKILGGLFAVLAVLASFGMGNLTQSNSIAEAMNSIFGIPAPRTGLVITLITILVVLGGIRSISRITQVLVPFMGILYLAGCLLVILVHWRRIPASLAEILGMAFCPQAFAGGAAGQMTVSVMSSVRWGVSRGVFSNEAGLGVSGISASSAGTRDYVRQGYISMTSVFLDTIVICTLTGLALMCSGALDRGGAEMAGAGIALTIAAFRTGLGEFGACFVGICIVLFAFATIAGWAYQGEKAFAFLARRPGSCIWYRFFYSLLTFVGAVCSLETVWNFADLCNGLLVLPNLCGVLALSKGICEEIRAYRG